jgi:hypothetical protein
MPWAGIFLIFQAVVCTTCGTDVDLSREFPGLNHCVDPGYHLLAIQAVALTSKDANK